MDNFDLTKFLAEGKLYEAMSPQDIVDIADTVAEEFTKESADEGDFLIYTVGRMEGEGFELDTDISAQTPDSIDTRGVGEGWGGIFRIKPSADGYEVRNAEKGGLVAMIDNMGNFRMLSADESRAEMGMADGEKTDYMERRREMSDYIEEDDELNPGMYIDDEEWEREMGRMEENKEETKSNKMKKSELKEMIKAAMLEDARTDAEQEGYKDGFEDAKDDIEAELKKMKVSEAEDEDVEKDVNVDVEDDENVDVDIEKDIEVDDEETEADIDVKASVSGESKEVEAVQGLLTKALEMSQALGDEKLEDQIGNTITYFTRAHVSRVNEMNLDIDGASDAASPEMEAELGLEEGELKEDVSSKFIQKYLSMDPPEGIEDIESYSDRDKAILTYLEVGPGVTVSDKVAKAIKGKSGADIIKYFQDEDYSYMPYGEMRRVLGVPAVAGFTFDESGSDDAEKWYLNPNHKKALNKIWRTKYPELNIPDVDFETKFDTTEKLNDYFRELARDQKGKDLEVTYEEYAENYVQFLKDNEDVVTEGKLHESVMFPMWNKIK